MTSDPHTATATQAEEGFDQNDGSQESFQADVGRLLDILTHAVYTRREVFLRELISNASDACDRLRFRAIREPELLESGVELAIRVTLDAQTACLEVSDNGIGMDETALRHNIGTLARSGTGEFLRRLGQNERNESAPALIGQFGIGFYSVFMVASRVRVVTRPAGQQDTWCWESDGRNGFTVRRLSEPRPSCGTTVILTLKDDAKEFLEPLRLRHIIQSHSEHAAFPVHVAEKDGDASTDPIADPAKALWTRERSEVSPREYADFYQRLLSVADEPWLVVHYKAEGLVSYTALLFVPGARPFDLFDPQRTSRLRLYAKRVLVNDEAGGMLPSWLRFVRGVVDSDDLPLALSREAVQSGPVMERIQRGLVSRIVSALKEKAEADRDAFETFWVNFGPVLKEGLFEAAEPEWEKILPLVLFRSTHKEGRVWRALSEYVAAMPEGQKEIYYVSAKTEEAALASPQIEGLRLRGVEVLLSVDPIDQFWFPLVKTFQDIPLRSVTRGTINLEGVNLPDGNDADQQSPHAPAEGTEEKDDTRVAVLASRLGERLKEKVSGVRLSDRLVDSPCCLSAGDTGADLHLDRLVHNHPGMVQRASTVLELNPRHAMVRELSRRVTASADDPSGVSIGQAAELLYGLAVIGDAQPLESARAFIGAVAKLVSPTKAADPLPDPNEKTEGAQPSEGPNGD